jgi:hypothetical protein
MGIAKARREPGKRVAARIASFMDVKVVAASGSGVQLEEPSRVTSRY